MSDHRRASSVSGHRRSKSSVVSPTTGHASEESVDSPAHQTRFSFYDANEFMVPVSRRSRGGNSNKNNINSNSNGNNEVKSQFSYDTIDNNKSATSMAGEIISTSPTKVAASLSALKFTMKDDDDDNTYDNDDTTYDNDDTAYDEDTIDDDFDEKSAAAMRQKHRSREAAAGGLTASNNSMDSVGILRSLQEHEQQRLDILSSFGSPASMSSLLPPKSSSEKTRPSKLHSTVVRPGDSVSVTSNPYEDAIKDALKLLRKHRTTIKSSNNSNGNQNTTMEGQMGGLARSPKSSKASTTFTPRPPHLLTDELLKMQTTSAGVPSTPTSSSDPGAALGEAYQAEIETRRKQRQERMARYANRLAELKQEGESDDGGGDGISSPINNNTSISISAQAEQQHAADAFVVGNPAAASASTPKPAALPSDGNESATIRSSGVGSAVMSSSPGAALDTAATSAIIANALASHRGDQAAAAAGASAPQSQQEEEVQRGVERVLLAILERANSRGRGNAATTSISNKSESYVEEEKKSSCVDSCVEASDDDDTKVAANDNNDDDDELTRAMSDLLGCASADDSDAACAQHRSVASESQDGHQTENLLDTSGGEIEAVRFEPDKLISLNSKNNNLNPRQVSGSPDEEQDQQQNMVQQALSDQDELDMIVQHALENQAADKDDEGDLPQLSTATSSSPKTDNNSNSAEKEDSFDQRIREIVSNSEQTAKLAESINDESYLGSATDNVALLEDDSMYCRLEELQGGSRPQQSYGEEEKIEHDPQNDALDGVLGPLSMTAGGTTGVVLEADSPTTSSIRGQQEENVTSPSILDSLAAAMSRVTGGAAVVHNDAPAAETTSPQTVADSCNQSEDGEVKSANNNESLELMSADHDPEAYELMRTLCAHLLPFGVDKSESSHQQLLEQLPEWDESNADEAGYRIIRLTKHQLKGVEKSFDHMLQMLKKDSEHNLALENSEADCEAFERDLKEAEELLDRVEKRELVEVETDGNTTSCIEVSADHGKVSPSPETSIHDDDDDDDQPRCLKKFPGVKPGGKGEMGDLEFFTLPIIFKSHITGFEPTKDMILEAGNILAGQYLVEGELGSAAFSTAYRCVDLSSEDKESIGSDGHEEVCLKVIRNTKDFFDQSLDEIKILELLRQTGKCKEKHIVEMKNFFYHREHLIIVTELLRQNLFEFGKFIIDNDEEPYFTISRLGYITRQQLIALDFVHQLGLVHSDVKPENILLASYSRAKSTLIDFGSSCYLTDRQSSYIQSRSYRAPEVVLGLPYDGKIDVWSLGCVVAEMFTGEVTFQNDSVVSMLSRIEAICGPFPRHMIAQGRQSGRFFTTCGLLFENVSNVDDEESYQSESSGEDNSGQDVNEKLVDIFQPKITTLSARLGFEADLLELYDNGGKLTKEQQRQAIFADFVRKLLTVDPDGRPSASEALKHPWMVYAATLTEEDIKYPSN